MKKQDEELLNKILLEIENIDPAFNSSDFQFDGYTRDDIDRMLELIYAEQLFIAIEAYSKDGKNWIDMRLTMAGMKIIEKYKEEKRLEILQATSKNSIGIAPIEESGCVVELLTIDGQKTFKEKVYIDIFNDLVDAGLLKNVIGQQYRITLKGKQLLEKKTPEHNEIKMSVFKVFLSSPNDVKDDRDAVEQMILDFSKKTEKDYGIKLVPLVWEKHVAHGPGRPQEKANKLVKKCQVYIGFLGKRFGSPTGLMESGTEEEFTKAFLKWEDQKCPDMRFFFKEVQINPRTDDMAQTQKVIDFEKRIRGQFLADRYISADDLKKKVEKELKEIVEKFSKKSKVKIKKTVSGTRAITEAEVLEKYSDYLTREYDRIQIFQDKFFSFKDIYVSLSLEYDPRLWHEMGEQEFRKKARQCLLSGRMGEVILDQTKEPSESGRQDHFTIEEVLAAASQVVILGEAGSGKTTLFKHLSAEYRDLNRYLPVYLPIRSWLKEKLSDPLSAFARTLNDKKKHIEADDIPVLENALQSFWAQGKTLLLLDGLDEIGQEEFTQVCRELNRLSVGANKVLVSCRRSSFISQMEAKKWSVYCINPFSETDREQFIRNYFGKENPLALKLSGLVEGRTQLKSLGQIPLLLGLICYVYEKDKESLPESRVLLYEKCINELLARRLNQAYPAVVKKSFLELLAYRFFKDPQQANRQIFPEAEIFRLLNEEISRSGSVLNHLTGDRYASFIEEIVEKNSLLLPLGKENYCFPHRSFQEYFAACHLEKKGQSGFTEIIETLAADDFWTETICLYVGMVADATLLVDQLGKKEKIDLVLRIIPQALKLDWDKLDKEKLNWKIRRGAVEKLVHPDFDKSKSEELSEVLRGVLKNDPNGNVRYSALIGLEKIGTPAALEIVKNTYIIPPEVLKEYKPYKYQARGKEFPINQPGMPPNMILVLGGTYTMGESKDKVKVKDFSMSIFPVTNWEFRSFIEAGGYENKEYWSAESWRLREKEKWNKPVLWEDPRFNQEWQPVVGVNFYEVEAYCKWFTEKHKCQKNPFRLPSEKEWEWAARGPEGDEYAFAGKWNEDISRWDSYKEYEKGLTFGASRVNTVYRECVSGYGLFDMSGNVWEWTCTEYGYGSDRVNRGGGWRNGYPPCLRSAYCFWNNPAVCYEGWGFRLVKAMP